MCLCERLCDSIRRKTNRKCRYEESKNLTFGLWCGSRSWFSAPAPHAYIFRCPALSSGLLLRFSHTPSTGTEGRGGGLDGWLLLWYASSAGMFWMLLSLCLLHHTPRSSHLALPLPFRFLDSHSPKKTHFALLALHFTSHTPQIFFGTLHWFFTLLLLLIRLIFHSTSAVSSEILVIRKNLYYTAPDEWG